MAWMAHSVPMNWSLKRVISTALLLALPTVFYSFLPLSGNRRWLDVGIDMKRALLGVALVSVLTKILLAHALPE